MSKLPEVLSPTLREESSAQVTFQIVDAGGAGFLPTTLTLTLYLWPDTTAIINARDAQNVLNQNDVTVDSSGNVAWEIRPEDLAWTGPDGDFEYHVALFEWTWPTGRRGNKDYALVVQSVEEVP